jgi:hypothetical protein
MKLGLSGYNSLSDSHTKNLSVNGISLSKALSKVVLPDAPLPTTSTRDDTFINLFNNSDDF